MIGEYVLPLIGLVGGLVLLTVLVSVLLIPPLRRLARARAALASQWSTQGAVLRTLGSHGAGAPLREPISSTRRLRGVDSTEGTGA